EDGVDDGTIGRQEGSTVLGDGIKLLGAARGLEAHIAELFQEGQRRIDDARARAVHAAELVLDGLDQLVAVAGLLGNQLEQHVAQIAVVENAAAAAAVAVTLAGMAAAEAEGTAGMAPFAAV